MFRYERAKKIIGKRILEVRKRISDLNQSDFGALFGVKNVAVSQWENGETMPSVEVLEKVADMAGESLDWLFGREDKTISNEERRLLRFFRGTSEEGQEIVLETVEDIFFDHPKRWWYCYHCLILSLFFMGCYMRKSLEDELLGVVKELSTEALNRILVIAKSAKNRNASCCFLCAFLCIKRSTTNLSSALDEASNTLGPPLHQTPIDQSPSWRIVHGRFLPNAEAWVQ